MWIVVHFLDALNQVGYDTVHNCNTTAHQNRQNLETIRMNNMLIGIQVSINN